MKLREIAGEQESLRIYISSARGDLFHPYYKKILERSRSANMAGCTIQHGFAGFGSSRRIHEFFPESAEPLPVIIEIIDSREHLQRFLDQNKDLLEKALVLREKLHVHHYEAASEKGST